jgi:hypothetical protein
MTVALRDKFKDIPESIFKPLPTIESDQDDQSSVLAKTARGILRINDIDQDGVYDGIQELEVVVLGETTSDLASVSSALNEICVSDVRVGTPYDSLRRYATLYKLAGNGGLDGLREQMARSNEGADPEGRLAQLKAVADSFELARHPKFADGVTVNERALDEEGTRLYANLREEVLTLRREVYTQIEYTNSPEELEAAHSALDKTWYLFADFHGEIDEIAANVDHSEAYARLAERAFRGFEENAARDSESARKYLDLYDQFCKEESSICKVSEKRIKEIWQDAAQNNIRRSHDD